jgi:glutathione reductase (NADPH)
MLRFIDRDMAAVLEENMTKLGMKVVYATHEKVEKDENGKLNVFLKDGSTISCDQCLIALGRPPCLEGLGIENTGITLKKDNSIQVDDFNNTSVDKVYAIGDVTNRINLTPVAIREAAILVERLFNGRTNLKMNYDNVATVVFSHPPIGNCGMGEEEALKKYGDKIKVFRSNFTNMFYSPAQSDDLKLKSLFKLVCL